MISGVVFCFFVLKPRPSQSFSRREDSCLTLPVWHRIVPFLQLNPLTCLRCSTFPDDALIFPLALSAPLRWIPLFYLLSPRNFPCPPPLPLPSLSPPRFAPKHGDRCPATVLSLPPPLSLRLCPFLAHRDLPLLFYRFAVLNWCSGPPFAWF